MEEHLYDPASDDQYRNPYIEEEGWRDDLPVRCYFVHGGWKETDQGGLHVKFCFYFPEKDAYEGRFFQYLSPAPEDERESEKGTGEDDRITFALTHGAYYVVSNQGGFTMPLAERCYKANAQSAVLSRKYAVKLYGYEHRPFGYCFGGSGGSFKTFGAIECTNGVWDGAVPYVCANPMATPNVFCPRMRVMRVLGEEGLKKLVDRMDVGGSGDLYEELDDYQKEALEEATKMGFPKRGWFSWETMGDGALSVLLPTVYRIHKEYFTDFWTKPGYEGTNPNSSEVRDHIKFVTTVKELISRKKPVVNPDDVSLSTVDSSWIACMIGNQETPNILLAECPPADAYLFHARLKIMSGKLAGSEAPIESIEDGILKVGAAFDGSNAGNALEGLEVGDQIMIDNGDYLAMQTFQRHQVPDETYSTYDMYRDENGQPKYPQFPMLISPMIAYSGAGTVPCGNIHTKVIALCSMLDESAFAWHGDWYRKAVVRCKGNEDDFRLYFNDNCIHDDTTNLTDRQRLICYLGILHQSLIDVANWVEKGIEPPQTSGYELVDGQIELADTVEERKGMQPLVTAFVEGQKVITIPAGKRVSFTATIDAPVGKITGAAWDYEKTNDFTNYVPMVLSPDGKHATVTTSFAFAKPGTYFPTIKVQSSRTGTREDIYVQCRNLDRVRVIVTEAE